MQTELVDVEVRKDGETIQSFTSRLDVNHPTDRAAFLRDMEAHLGVSDPENYEIQIWRRKTDLGTYQLGAGQGK